MITIPLLKLFFLNSIGIAYTTAHGQATLPQKTSTSRTLLHQSIFKNNGKQHLHGQEKAMRGVHCLHYNVASSISL